VDHPDHSDFAQLREILFHSHLKDFKEIIHEVLYEQYRTERLENGYEV
jgi:cell division control protein 11